MHSDGPDRKGACKIISSCTIINPDTSLGSRAHVRGLYILEGRLLQVDTFTEKRYSLHWIIKTKPCFMK